MSRRRSSTLVLAAMLAATIGVFLLVWLLTGSPRPAQADPGILCVAPGGTGCSAPCGETCYASVQTAVDDAVTSDEIRVAEGDYTDVQVRSGVTQAVYMSKTLTIRGGYTTTNWTTSYPITQPTTLDAGSQGRVLYITGDISPTVEGLRITGGDGVGLGGSLSGNDAGGGVYIYQATVLISGCVITDNSVGPASTSGSGTGGGIYFRGSDGRLEGNDIVSNTARWGGGIRAEISDCTLVGNQIMTNTAYYGGGGYLTSGSPMVEDNLFRGNESRNGGGIGLAGCPATLAANVVQDNSAWYRGGGIWINSGMPVEMERNLIVGNDAGYEGGGVYLNQNDAVLTNNVVMSNVLNYDFYEGPGIWIGGGVPVLLHTSVASNTGSDHSGIYVDDSATVALTNTILVSQSVGITVSTGTTATLDGVLWHGNGVNYGGAGTITVSHELTGSPAFAADGYHLTAASPAIGQGISSGATDDIDGEPRPTLHPDLGADELNCLVQLNDGAVYTSVQAAVDASAAPGDVVRVAGTCYEHDVAIAKSLTLQGGWSLDFSIRDPAVYTSTLDAQELGRGIYVTGTVDVTLEGLDLTRGRASGASREGGGVYAANATVVVSDCRVFSNTAKNQGGGFYLLNSDGAALIANEIFSNTAQNSCGGICLEEGSGATLNGNSVHHNATEWGGGIGVQSTSGATLAENDVYSNTGTYGAGVRVYDSDATLVDNAIFLNAAVHGGGVHVDSSEGALLIGNNIYSNTASNNDFGSGGGYGLENSNRIELMGNQVYGNRADSGGGLSLNDSHSITLTNNLLAENQSVDAVDGAGAGIYMWHADARILHTTLARNTGGGGQGVFVGAGSTALMTNTILVSHTVGIETNDSAAAAILDTTLWGQGAWANKADVQISAGTVTTTTDVRGDPAFVDPDRGDYHIGASSAAVDMGAAVAVTEDIDGEVRPVLYAPDIGADEYAGECLARLNDGMVYTSTQTAVAAASPGDVVRVSGTCYEHDVIITRTLTLQGGWGSGFITHDPDVYPSTMDAQRQGRVLRISGGAPTVEYLDITNGDADGNDGGGVLVSVAGGGTTLRYGRIYSNTTGDTSGRGGGVYVDGDDVTLLGNEIYSNTSSGRGGGVCLDGDDATLVGNDIRSNRTTNVSDGGGVAIGNYRAATLRRNTIRANTAHRNAGGVSVGDFTDITLVNNVIADNVCCQSSFWTGGSGVWFGSGEHLLVHNTLADNRGGDGSAIRLYGDAVMTNTIIFSHSVGISATASSVATLEGTLWYNNGQDAGGPGTVVTGTVDLHQDPSFVDGSSGDYRLNPSSPAVNAGVTVFWVGEDRDENPRPDCSSWDIGAYEVQGLPCSDIYLPLVLRNNP
jgi:parallel beta-helix repeat protein